jgi:hypothetical protein
VIAEATRHKNLYGIITDIDAGSTAMLSWTCEDMIGGRSLEFLRLDGEAANMAAASAALRPCTDASTIPARRNRNPTRSRAVRVILTRRCASAGSRGRTNTSGCRAITTSTDSLPGPHTADQDDTITAPTFLAARH